MTRAKARTLLADVAVYGAGDVAVSAVSFLLIPIYTRVLTPTDYGVFALLLTIEAGAKILLRWGADAAFMRLYYDCADHEARRTLASTIWLFLVAANAPILAAGLLLAPAIGSAMFGTDAYTGALRVFFLNTFAIGFFFIPFNVYRIEGRSARFAALTFARAAGTTALRLALVVGWQMGVFGLVVADLILTGVVALCLAPTVADLLRPRFSAAVLREALGFGLPRVPHGLAHQVTALSDRWVLNTFLTPDRVGVYSIGATFGLTIKLFLSAFDYAWAPFAFDAMKRPAAKDLYRQVTTYVTALLVLLAAGLSAGAEDLVALMTEPAFHDAGAVVPWIAAGVVFQGFYQLTAVGLSITKRTALLPVATTSAAVVALGANLVLVPRFGMLGAAWAATLSYGTLAAAGCLLSQRVYPIRYDWRSLGWIAAAGVGSYAVAVSLLDDAWPPAARLLLRGLVAATGYLVVLAAAGVVRPRELVALVRARQTLPSPVPESTSAEIADLGGEVASVPSHVDERAPTRDPRKVE
jgi:O-antigen/teichoic acid export membrane protein